MKTLALLLLLALPSLAAPQPDQTPAAASTAAAVQAPTPPPGSLDSSKIRLDAQDAAGALADAETALAHGGGADAYAARADAKRALGHRMDEVIADYAEAAKLDPRYIEKYKGLIAQRDSEAHPDSRSKSLGNGLGGVPIVEIGVAAAAGGVLIAIAMMLLRGRGDHSAAPDDDGRPPNQEPPKA